MQHDYANCYMTHSHSSNQKLALLFIIDSKKLQCQDEALEWVR